MNIHEVVEQAGTPCYVYDAEIIRTQYQKIMAALPQGKTQLYYAMKAL